MVQKAVKTLVLFDFLLVSATSNGRSFLVLVAPSAATTFFSA